jgi:hypothetical protein
VTAYTWTDLTRNAFRAMIGHAAILRIIEPTLETLIVETAAKQGRDLLENPDPTDAGNPLVWLAQFGALQSGMIAEHQRTIQYLRYAVPLAAAGGGLIGGIVVAVILGLTARL